MVNLVPYTIEEQIAELERELTMRARVYPSLIERRKISHGTATRQNEILRAAIETLWQIVRDRKAGG